MNTKSKLIIAFVVLFLTGVVTGVMGTRIVYRNMLAKALERPSILSERVEASLGNLSLSPEQDQKIAQILTESREQSQNLREEFRPRFWTILTETHRKIDSELTPEQRSQFRNAVRDNLPLLQRVIERHEAEAQ
ncbi:MAG: hypothetical protein P1U82_02475 [Verrucomicrobiales bacterium]|jgi:uncharacterized membrane protein|nr:hypothetical protein [Verrucomicrobiales bacterium]